MSRIRTAIMSVFCLGLVALAFPMHAFADTYSVSITSTQFIPATLNVAVGDTIRFINTTAATQSARTTDPDGFNTGNIGPGENKSVVVSNAGTYSYTSQYDETLSGSVVVAASSDTLSGDTSTPSSMTTTSQPVQTQEQPVSGVFDVFLAVLTAGIGFIVFGFITHRFQPRFQTVDSTVDIPSISVRTSSEPEATSSEYDGN